jgi:menaquinone-dependent protoporphyrinogen oxidase
MSCHDYYPVSDAPRIVTVAPEMAGTTCHDIGARVLVAYASRHGATGEIAETLAGALRRSLLDATVDVVAIEDVAALDCYDAVVVGSAVYMGRWLEPARRFVEAHAAELAHRPVWLFSSGPVGDPPRPAEEPADVARMRELSGARDHHVFAGKLDRRRLRLAERAVVAAFRAAEGDFRNWADVSAWATQVADGMLTASVPTPA